MTYKPDDWAKPRGRHLHFTDVDIARVKRGYVNNEAPRDVARELQSATKTIMGYYRNFSLRGIRQGEARPLAANRFYRSNFEPS